jgi:hypothetical protein
VGAVRRVDGGPRVVGEVLLGAAGAVVSARGGVAGAVVSVLVAVAGLGVGAVGGEPKTAHALMLSMSWHVSSIYLHL